MHGATTTVVRWVRAPQRTSRPPAECPAVCRTKWPSASCAGRPRLWQCWTTERWLFDLNVNVTQCCHLLRSTDALCVSAGLRLGLQRERTAGTREQREPADPLPPRRAAGLMCAAGMGSGTHKTVYLGFSPSATLDLFSWVLGQYRFIVEWGNIQRKNVCVKKS